MNQDWVYQPVHYCSSCGAPLARYAEGFRDTCVECLPDAQEEPDGSGNAGFMGPSGLRKEYWD